MEVALGIHQLKVPIPVDPPGYINSYLVEGNDGWLLVDTGWNDRDDLEVLTRQLKELDSSPEDISHYDALGTETKTAYELATQIPWMLEEGGDSLTLEELSPMNRAAAVGETLAHLELMLSQDKVNKVIKDDIVFFRAV